MILHKGQPLEVVLDVRGVRKEMDRFAFENSQNTFFLIRPRAWRDPVRDQVARKRAVKGEGSVPLPTECPIPIGRVGYQIQILFPGLKSVDLGKSFHDYPAVLFFSGIKNNERKVRK